MGVLVQDCSLKELLEILGNDDIVYRILKLHEEIGFVLGVLAMLWVLLVPVLGSFCGVMLKVDRDFRDSEALAAAKLFELGLRNKNPLYSSFFPHEGK